MKREGIAQIFLLAWEEPEFTPSCLALPPCAGKQEDPDAQHSGAGVSVCPLLHVWMLLVPR